MIWRGIRSQLLFVALAPAILVAVLLTIVFVHGRVTDLSNAHKQRGHALANQLGANAEFELFSGNRPALQVLANAAMREQDITAVAILDRDGGLMARAGRPSIDLPAVTGHRGAAKELDHGARYLVVQPVAPSELAADTLFNATADRNPVAPPLLGYVALELSTESLKAAERALISAGLLVTLIGLAFGTLLAVRLSRGVSRPLVDLSEAVERVGRGDLQARVVVEGASPLRGLEEGVNRMAARLEQARDSLERRVVEATAELRAKKEEAEQANVAKSRFVAAASHDLRQPMHALGLFVDNLRGEISGHGERARRLLDGMSSAIDAMTAMFNALLDISRLDAGVIAVGAKDFPVRHLLEQIETVFTPLALERGLRFSVVASSAWIRSDPRLLERIVQNLVSNALKHTAGGGVVVGCRRLPNALSIQVRDTGPGIAEEHQQKIFQEFFQLTNPERDRTKGLGLGLAIVDRTARLLGHPVRVRSTPGRGATFAIEVPYGERGTDDAHPVQLELIAESFDGICVAVIDDDQGSLDAMTGLLERWRCTVVGAESDDALLARVRVLGAAPHLVISDYRLRHGRTGIEAIERIRGEWGRALPAILVTGDTAPDRLAEAHASRLELLHKPVSPEQLKFLMRLLLPSPVKALSPGPVPVGLQEGGAKCSG